MFLRRAKIWLFSSLLMVSSATAQQIIDRIVAVVDDELILQSELEQALRFEMSQQALTATEKYQLRDQLLEAMVNDKVLLIKAKRDSIVVSDNEVDDALQEQLDRIKAEVGSEEEYGKLLEREGITERELRRRYRSQIRNYLLKQKVMASLSNQIVISYKDVVDFYNAHIDSLPPRPQMVSLSQIFLR
ncbi:MAG: SurA N-terminal domain-containing protein, partial [Candidatus Latescibacteria bacterium]|nr:SurA N-terminal domain-containing protein [Candidatus Latescibacterota bacterium]